jgi:hypothetical protein
MLPTSGTVSDDHVSRTRFRIIRMEALVVDCGYGNRVDAVRVPVEVALITICRSISTGKNENGSLPTSPIVDAIHNSFLDEVAWTFHRLAIIRGAPTAGIYGDILEAVIESSCFINV